MFGWLRKPEAKREEYKFDRWIVLDAESRPQMQMIRQAVLQSLGEQTRAEEKTHPSGMWDWISPNRLRSTYSNK